MTEQTEREWYAALVDGMNAHGGRTCTLAEYQRAMDYDDNFVWRVEHGHINNLLEDAVEENKRLRGQVEDLTDEVERLCVMVDGTDGAEPVVVTDTTATRSAPRSLSPREAAMGTVRWFGESWGAPICEDSPRIETPINEDCARCRGAIEEGQQGVTVPYVNHPYAPEPTVTRLAWHLDCWLREITGDAITEDILQQNKAIRAGRLAEPEGGTDG